MQLSGYATPLPGGVAQPHSSQISPIQLAPDQPYSLQVIPTLKLRPCSESFVRSYIGGRGEPGDSSTNAGFYGDGGSIPGVARRVDETQSQALWGARHGHARVVGYFPLHFEAG